MEAPRIMEEQMLLLVSFTGGSRIGRWRKDQSSQMVLFVHNFNFKFKLNIILI